MDILNLLFNVNTAQVTSAQQKVQQLGQASQQAAQQGHQIGQAFGSLSGVSPLVQNATSAFQDLRTMLTTVRLTALGTGVALTALAGVSGVVAAIRFTGPLDDITKLAEKFGISATQAAIMAQNMDPAGMQTYFGAIDKVSKALTKADEEGAKANEALRILGVNTKEAGSSVEVLNELTERYGKRLKEDNLTAEESASLQLILGKSYRDVMMQVNEAAYAQERMAEWSQANLKISDDGARAANEFADANDYLSDMFKIVGSTLVGEVVPAFTGLIRALVDSFKNGGTVRIMFEAVRAAAQLVLLPIRALGSAFVVVDTIIASVGKGLKAVWESMSTMSTAPLSRFMDNTVDVYRTAKERIDKIWSMSTPGEDYSNEGRNYQKKPNTPSTEGGGKPAKTPKTPKTPKEERVDTGRFESDNTDDWQKEWLKVQADLERDAKQKQDRLANLKRQYEELINPVVKYYDQLSEVEELHKAGMITDNERETQIFRINTAIADLTANAREAGEDFTLMQRIGETAFSGLEDSLVNLASTGELNFKSLVSSIIGDIMRLFVQMTIIAPLMAMLRQMMGLPAVASANGNVFGSTGILKSAKGNVFDSPTLHGYSGGIGMLGEAGPEAIMPLKRGADGKLGVVASSGGGGGVVQQNITVQVNVEGGSNAQETGDIVSGKVVQAIKGIVKQEIAVSKKAAAYAV